MQKLLSLICLFLLLFHYSRSGSKGILLQFMSKSVLSMPSSESFIVSGLTFRSLIHFEFIFGYGIRRCSNFERLLLSQIHRDSWPPEEKNSIRGQRRGLIAQSFCVIKFY